MTFYCAGPGQPHKAIWLVRATNGHPYQSAACDKHRDHVTAHMTVRGRPPTITQLPNQPTP